MKNDNEQQPAFPCMPIQDQFNRLIAPIPGMSKLEYFTLIIYAHNLKELLPESAISLSKEILIKLNESEKSDETTLKIIQ
jgi:hypothetical protein